MLNAFMPDFDPSNPNHIYFMCSLALKAGKNAMLYFHNDIDVETKSNDSPVTIADREGEEIIIRGIKSQFSKIQIIGEESSENGLPDTIEDKFFLLDPLDGTKEFINKRTDFTVNIGFIDKSAPVSGIVYAPALNRLFFTLDNKAYETNIAPDDKIIDDIDALFSTLSKAKEIRVRPKPDDGLVVVASRSHLSPDTEAFLKSFTVKEIVSAGSSLKFCLLATGEADIYPRHGRTMEWDTAAAHALLCAAGGIVHDIDGTILSYGKIARGLDNPYFIAST